MDMRQKVACPICGELQMAFWMDSHLVTHHRCDYSNKHYKPHEDCFFCGERFTNCRDKTGEAACQIYYDHFQQCAAYAACLLAGAVVVDHRERWNE